MTMQIYWTTASLPEMQGLEPSKQNAIWRACWLRPFLHWQTWLAFFGQFVFIFGGAAVGSLIDGWPQAFISGSIEHLRLPIFAAICFVLGGGIGAFIFSQIYVRVARPYLQAYREAHNAA
jgi:hypothetical protein